MFFVQKGTKGLKRGQAKVHFSFKHYSSTRRIQNGESSEDAQNLANKKGTDSGSNCRIRGLNNNKKIVLKL